MREPGVLANARQLTGLYCSPLGTGNSKSCGPLLRYVRNRTSQTLNPSFFADDGGPSRPMQLLMND